MEDPSLAHMSVRDLVALLALCSESTDASDLRFADQCREEIKRRKPDATDHR